MSRVERSIAMTAEVDRLARRHLLRSDRQEDICFGLWRGSRGQTRTTALIERLILPREGERNVHGNASFEPGFLERAMSEAAAAGAGLALLHSHPLGRGCQGLSRDDIAAEQGNAGAVFGATGLPCVGPRWPATAHGARGSGNAPRRARIRWPGVDRPAWWGTASA